MFGSTEPLRTLNVHDNGSTYTVTDTKDATLLYTIHWNANTAPHMTVYRGDDVKDTVGTATYHATKKLGFRPSTIITFNFASGGVSFNKEGGLISTEKRTLRSAVLGEVCWDPGYPLSGFMKLVDGKGKIVAKYKSMRVDGRIGTLEIDTELGQEELDDVVVSGIAMLSEQMSSMGATAAAVSVAGA